jgi:hypothetical protein
MKNIPWIWIIPEIILLFILVALLLSNVIDMTVFVIGAVIISSISSIGLILQFRKTRL